jgi:beta-galactosidase
MNLFPANFRGFFWSSRLILFFFFSLSLPAFFAAERVTMSLDGTWQIEESLSPTEIPKTFHHSVPVPGLANLSTPSFLEVDLFDSRELISNWVRSGKLPESARTSTAGIPRQKRNYFWYRTVFKAVPRKAIAILKINKAQFGTAVWLNGKKMGEYVGCFSAGLFNLTADMNWQGENELLVRIGAHPAVLPDTYPAGTDFEKLKWTPGIYDSVSVSFSDNPVIETVQVAPRITSSEILVQTTIRNYGPPTSFALHHKVSTWNDKKIVTHSVPEKVTLATGEEKVLTQNIKIPHPLLWAPESPYLYLLETSTGGDSAQNRFGMREFRFDTATKRAFLNGRVYFMRGSNITFHRFLEDPECNNLPWDEQWVRKLLVELPKKMHWNSFRFCIGPVPDRWLEIADEAGLLIQNEFFVWTGAPDWDPGYFRKFDVPEMIRQYKDWMRDNWNHPSVAVWDANNETLDTVFGREIIPAVRSLDLSNRPWENSYNLPAGPDDPVEDHPYLFQATAMGEETKFQMSDLEKMSGRENMGSLPDDARALILNEYGWVWLNRDGTPTLLTEKLYSKLLGPGAPTAERFDMNGYLLAGLTEFWRAHRQYAAVLHFVYLTCSYPGVYTSDHFQDVKSLTLEPHFVDYVGEAFKPLGVYLNFFQPTLKAGETRTIRIMMINDEYGEANGRLTLALENNRGVEVSHNSIPYRVAPLGQMSYDVELKIPSFQSEKCLLKASAWPDGPAGLPPTLSRRKVSIQ